jgi:hypothetical protein
MVIFRWTCNITSTKDAHVQEHVLEALQTEQGTKLVQEQAALASMA